MHDWLLPAASCLSPAHCQVLPLEGRKWQGRLARECGRGVGAGGTEWWGVSWWPKSLGPDNPRLRELIATVVAEVPPEV